METAKLLQISTLCKKTSSKKYGRSSKAEVPAKKARLVEPSDSLASPPPAPQPPPQQQQQPVFFRTQAIMAELQQATAAVSQDAVHLVPTDHIEVQAEEVVEIECTTEHMGNFNPHDSYCIPGGPPEPLSPPQQDHPSPPKQYKHTIVFEPYHTSTLKSTHSLAPKTCNMCGKVYSNLSNLRQHVNLVHTASKSVQCPLCGKFFKSDLYMRRHLICAHSVTPVRREQLTW
ncbi:hypothetical protein B566_EDAN011645 [Ephemera danica]|nr:hypothetical protein B566_EDAN011645 [Ephemera danica]